MAVEVCLLSPQKYLGIQNRTREYIYISENRCVSYSLQSTFEVVKSLRGSYPDKLWHTLFLPQLVRIYLQKLASRRSTNRTHAIEIQA